MCTYIYLRGGTVTLVGGGAVSGTQNSNADNWDIC